MQYTCEICEKSYESLWGLSNHRSKKHDIRPKETYIKYILNNNKPTCKCGCGEEPKFLGINEGFRDFIRGHSSKINNNWGHNPQAQKKSKETQKKMYDSGEIVIWNKGLTKHDDPRLDYGDKFRFNKERSEKISKALKGRKMSEDVMKRLDQGMRKYWSKKENREKQSHKRVNHIKKNGFVPTSKVEKYFGDILTECGFNFYEQFYVREIKALYDFKINDRNILIEVDGDFWHCNPNTKFSEPTIEHQRKNLIKDKIKNEWCKNNNYMLLRFWESDINNRPEWVKSELLKHIS
jgi:G:T-mismatch repair DNA endonuclease (very short patch repair protein)